MAGAIAIVVVLLIFPSLVLMSGGVLSALVGFVLQRDGEERHEGSELLALSLIHIWHPFRQGRL